MRISVVIPTYNRPQLLARAIRSVEEHLPEAEIVVVDDASLMPVAVGPKMRYIRQPLNQGPGAARNRGIAHATGDWIICLDDDDTICSGAAETIARAILTTPGVDRYPVLQFRTGNAGEIAPLKAKGSLVASATAPLKVTHASDRAATVRERINGGSHTSAPSWSRLGSVLCAPETFIRFGGSAGPCGTPWQLLDVEDYLSGAVTGDYTPVLQAEIFRSSGLHYPPSRTGSEHELWYQVAERWGIPTWSENVVEVHHERGARLCSAAAQIRESRSHALSQERTLAAFGHLMDGPLRSCRLRHLLGASTYWLVAGERRRSRDSSRAATHQFHSVRAVALFGLSYLPTACARVLLRGYRRLQGV